VSFDDLWADAARTRIGGVEVRIASVQHLIRMKEAAGRPQDLVDLERLRARLLD
jgi:predicted nucleotidyltransferase